MNFRMAFLLTVCLMICIRARAAVINATGLDYASVSNAVAQANTGDTVQLPVGTNGWYKTLTISGITLQGSGTNSTRITDETPVVPGGYGTGTPFLILNTTPSAMTRVTAIQFASGVTNNISTFPGNNGPNIQVNGATPFYRIDNCMFVLLSGKTIRQTGDDYGLIDHNNFHTYDRISVEIFGAGYGDGDWANPIFYGSTNSTYIEDNYFKDDNDFGWVDVSDGGRVVFRYNLSDGFFLNTHGTESSQRYRSARYIEAYMNTFNHNSRTNSAFSDFYTGIDMRGGSAVIFSNNFNAVNTAALLRYYRATDNSPAFTPFWGCTGITNWENNGAQLLTGSALGTTNPFYLTVSNASWTPNQWYGCTVYNYQSNKCGIVQANTANTMTFNQQGQSAYLIGFKDGDQFTVHKVYPMLDGIGVGTGDLLTGDNPTPINLNQTAEPLYCWKNILLRMENVLTPESSNAVTAYSSIVEGRDFTNAVKVGYTPLAHPFPLPSVVPAIPNSFTFGAFKL